MRIFAGVPSERGSISTINANFEPEFCGRTAWRIFFTKQYVGASYWLYVENQHPINALNAICLNSFRIKSAQSSGRIGVNEIRAE